MNDFRKRVSFQNAVKVSSRRRTHCAGEEVAIQQFSAGAMLPHKIYSRVFDERSYFFRATALSVRARTRYENLSWYAPEPRGSDAGGETLDSGVYQDKFSLRVRSLALTPTLGGGAKCVRATKIYLGTHQDRGLKFIGVRVRVRQNCKYI